MKVPLSEMFRIEEHKTKALSWLGGIGNSIVIKGEPSLGQHVQDRVKEKEDKGVISQIYCMIDLGASNIIMPFNTMDSLDLKVDTKQGIC